jgi:hypothetical protein
MGREGQRQAACPTLSKRRKEGGKGGREEGKKEGKKATRKGDRHEETKQGYITNKIYNTTPVLIYKIQKVRG